MLSCMGCIGIRLWALVVIWIGMGVTLADMAMDMLDWKRHRWLIAPLAFVLLPVWVLVFILFNVVLGYRILWEWVKRGR